MDVPYDALVGFLECFGGIAKREYTLPDGSRLDIGCHLVSGELIGIEVKTSRRDDRRDHKKWGYVQWCHALWIAHPNNTWWDPISPMFGVLTFDNRYVYMKRSATWHTVDPRFFLGTGALVPRRR